MIHQCTLFLKLYDFYQKELFLQEERSCYERFQVNLNQGHIKWQQTTFFNIMISQLNVSACFFDWLARKSWAVSNLQKNSVTVFVFKSFLIKKKHGVV